MHATTSTLSWRRFARHFGEMVLAMALGMVAGWVLIELALLPFGLSLTDASAPVDAGVMAVTMTVPMVAWMHYGHRMEVSRSIEMAASMLVPSALAVALYWAGAIGSDMVLVMQHNLMIPAMLGVMLWKREAYS